MRHLPLSTTRRHPLVVIAAVIALAAWPAFALAEETAPPIPGGAADASAVEVGDLAAIAAVAADTTDGGSAEAHAVEVGGAAPVPQVGGEQQGDGTSEGHLVDTGEAPVRAQATPWEASSEMSDGCRTASGTAAVARVDVEGLLDIDILQSSTVAEHCQDEAGASSSGAATGDAAAASVGDDALTANVLHFDQSEERGSSHALALDGEPVLPADEQLAEQCLLGIDGVLRLRCAEAFGAESEGTADDAGGQAETSGGGFLSAEAQDGPSFGVADRRASATPAATAGADGDAGAGVTGAPGGPGADDNASGSSAQSERASEELGAELPGEDLRGLAATGTDDLRNALAAVALGMIGAALMGLSRAMRPRSADGR
jgi:hypothetical protein